MVGMLAGPVAGEEVAFTAAALSRGVESFGVVEGPVEVDGLSGDIPGPARLPTSRIRLTPPSVA